MQSKRLEDYFCEVVIHNLKSRIILCLTQKNIRKIAAGDFKTIAQTLTIVENNLGQCDDILMNLVNNTGTKIIGITGPPGAGKSTLINALLLNLTAAQQK